MGVRHWCPISLGVVFHSITPTSHRPSRSVFCMVLFRSGTKTFSHASLSLFLCLAFSHPSPHCIFFLAFFLKKLYCYQLHCVGDLSCSSYRSWLSHQQERPLIPGQSHPQLWFHGTASGSGCGCRYHQGSPSSRWPQWFSHHQAQSDCHQSACQVKMMLS